jgi:hypothetical protein
LKEPARIFLAGFLFLATARPLFFFSSLPLRLSTLNFRLSTSFLVRALCGLALPPHFLTSGLIPPFASFSSALIGARFAVRVSFAGLAYPFAILFLACLR